MRKCSPPPKHVTCHVSHVTCHVSYVTCHLSHVTYHFFFYILIFFFLSFKKLSLYQFKIYISKIHWHCQKRFSIVKCTLKSALIRISSSLDSFLHPLQPKITFLTQNRKPKHTVLTSCVTAILKVFTETGFWNHI